MYGRYIRDLPHTAYDEKGKTPVLAPAAGEQLSLHSILMLNQAATPQNMAVMIGSLAATFKVFQYTAIGPVYTDVTAAIQGGTATSLITTTNNDGFVIGCRDKFNVIGLTVSQAGSGGAPVYAYEYWNGSAWVAVPAVIDTPNYALTGDLLFAHLSPLKWLAGGVTGADSTWYYLRIRATTAPAQAMKANAVWVGRFIHYQPSVPVNGILQMTFDHAEPRVLGGGETVIPYFQTANVANTVAAQYTSK